MSEIGAPTDQKTPETDEARKREKLGDILTGIKADLAEAARNLKRTDPHILTRQLREDLEKNNKK